MNKLDPAGFNKGPYYVPWKETSMKAYEEYYKLAKENNITMVQLAQAFVNSRPFVTSNIIGATSMVQLKENIESIDVKLDQDTLD